MMVETVFGIASALVIAAILGFSRWLSKKFKQINQALTLVPKLAEELGAHKEAERATSRALLKINYHQCRTQTVILEAVSGNINGNVARALEESRVKEREFVDLITSMAAGIEP
jgi:hypothetical protein